MERHLRLNSDMIIDNTLTGTGTTIASEPPNITPIRDSKGTNITGSSPASHQTAVLLPDGRLMDAKNTLHSFDTAPQSGRVVVVIANDSTSVFTSTSRKSGSNPPSIASPATSGTNDTATRLSRPPFMLPDGRIMDAKNTLQSFDIPPNVVNHNMNPVHHQKPDTAPGVVINTNMYRHDNEQLQNESTREENMTPVQAVAVHSIAMTLEAEPYHEPDRVPSLVTTQKFPNSSWKPVKIWLVVVIVVLMGAGIVVGSYCGTGHCSSKETSSNLRSSDPTIPPTAVPDSTVMVASSTESLTVACNFLSMTDISKCQSMTSFSGPTVGATIPSEIGLLTQLQLIDFLEEELVGSIPSTMGNLIHLTALYLYVNDLTGTIPPSLGNLVQLTGLYLAKNQLTGGIPSTFGNLVKLNYLYLYDNRLTGTLPSTLSNLIRLQDLVLSSNQLIGTIPATVLDSLVYLQHIGMGNNQLTGTIPSQIGSAIRLSGVGLENNMFAGTVPSTLGNLVQLTQIKLFGNSQLSGIIPTSLCTTNGTLIGIDCDGAIICDCCFETTTNIPCL